MTPFVTHPDAQAEITDGAGRSSDAPAYYADFAAAAAVIAANPWIGAPAGRTGAREYILTRLPYTIVYVVEPTAIRLIAFAHHKRRRGYWKSRLRRP